MLVEGKEVMPAGSMPPPIPEVIPDNPIPDKTSIEGAGEIPAKEPEPILGKYKDVDALAKAYQDMEQKYGSQSAEVGSMRKQVEMLTNLVANTNRQATPAAQPPQNDIAAIDAEINSIATRADANEISSGEATRLAAELATKKALILSQQFFGNEMKKMETNTMQRDFMKENPDFQQLVNSGQLDAIKRSNPMHDNVSAYYAYKAILAQQQIKEAEQASYNKGLETGSKLKDGSINTGKVLTKPGSSVRQTNQQGPLTDQQKREGMLAALLQAQGGGT